MYKQSAIFEALMLLYNVTICIDDDAHDAWLDWMKKEHIPEVMATGCFESCRMFLIEKHDPSDPGTNYGIQYYAADKSDFERYNRTFAPALKQKTQDLFGGRFVAFRTLLHEVDLNL